MCILKNVEDIVSQQNEQLPFISCNWTQKDHYIWHSKLCSWLGTGTKIWRGWTS